VSGPAGGPNLTAQILIAGTAIGFLVVDLISARIATGAWQLVPPRTSADRGTYLTIQLTSGVGVLLAVWAASRSVARLPGPADAWLAAGLTIAWLGIALRAWSVLSLGGEFRRTLVEGGDRRLITDGPYRIVLHPSYTAILLVFTGIGVALADAIALLALAVLPTVGLVLRIRAEELELRRTFGDVYEDYARGKARLLPGIW